MRLALGGNIYKTHDLRLYQQHWVAQCTVFSKDRNKAIQRPGVKKQGKCRQFSNKELQTKKTSYGRVLHPSCYMIIIVFVAFSAAVLPHSSSSLFSKLLKSAFPVGVVGHFQPSWFEMQYELWILNTVLILLSIEFLVGILPLRNIRRWKLCISAM